AQVWTAGGCDNAKPPADRERNPTASGEAAKIKASLDKLSPEDRALAEAQKTCPVTDQPLGSMGVPIKLMLKDQPVFVCCGGCPTEGAEGTATTLMREG